MKEGDQIATVTDNGEPVALIEVVRQSDDLLVVLESEIVIAIDDIFLIDGVKFYPLGFESSQAVQASSLPLGGRSAALWQASGEDSDVVSQLEIADAANLSAPVLGALGGLHWQL
ncbi:hypothetical protein OAC12_03465 [Porticoccaceae bacterium]|nr:hypothetical protein [Porticoccaceae bacterium]